LVVELDSKQCLRWMSENYKVSDFIIKLITDCKYLVSMFEELTFTHVLREENRCVDFLANVDQTKD